MSVRDDERLAKRLRDALGAAETRLRADGAERFAERLGEVADQLERVPIELDGRKIEARRGGSVLAAAMKNGVRLMHVCGGRALCTTCRVYVEFGAENLSEMRPAERIALRSRLVLGKKARLACQARVDGPVELHAGLPHWGNLPED
ncbi:MAG: 2Fe-2S iron-sulfur cluster-binding protein [Candidatus Binatia bacterium]